MELDDRGLDRDGGRCLVVTWNGCFVSLSEFVRWEDVRGTGYLLKGL